MLCALSLGVLPSRADLPAPDNILYGAIALSGQPVTAAHTNVVIEARRTVDGPVVSSYRMGSEPAAGNFYVLKLPLEELSPLASPGHSVVGSSVFIAVRDSGGQRTNVSFTVTERGLITRLDFVPTTIDADTDGDGLPDSWELARFGNLSLNSSSLGANGQTLLQHYTAGTDPNDPNDVFALTITQAAANKFVSFLARKASGPGYEGRSRIYALESTTNLSAGPWLGVPGGTNIVGNNASVSHQIFETGPRTFYRGQVRLQIP